MERVITTRLRAIGLAALSVVLLAAVSTARGAVEIEGLHTGLPDVDTRTTQVAPTAAQPAAAAQLDAEVSWNRFGTPSSVFDRNGKLGNGHQRRRRRGRTGVARPEPALFRLGPRRSSNSSATHPGGGGGHAVLLGQAFDGVLAAPDGLVTVAVTGSSAAGWDVMYASSSLAPSDAVATDFALSPEQAWVQAAKAVGEQVSAETSASPDEEQRLDGARRRRLRGHAVRARSAFPVPGKAARAAYQTLVVDGDALGYTPTIDASSGKVLAR